MRHERLNAIVSLFFRAARLEWRTTAMNSTKRKTTARKQNHRLGNGVLLTAEELAAQLGESVRSITTLKRKKAIPYIDLGYRTHRFRLNDVLAQLERRTIKPASMR
jgi:hypothetical protein